MAALQDTNFEVVQGEVVAIEGPSGGGKSTLLNLLGLLDTPTRGRVEVLGRNTSTLTDGELAEERSNHFGFIFQSFHLLERRPVLDSVELSLMYRGVHPGQRHQLASEALEQVGLGDYGQRRADELSGGQRQRVAIARALSTRAPVLIADEPTGNLDSENAAQVVDALLRANALGATVVIVTHSPEVAASAHRRIRIRDGRLSEPAALNETGPGAGTIPQRDTEFGTAREHTRVGAASRLRFRDLITDAIRGLIAKPTRTAALTAAVALGVGLTTATIGVSTSAQAQVSSTFDLLQNRDVTVSWDNSTFDDEDAELEAGIEARLREVAGVSAVGLLNSIDNVPIWITGTAEPLQPAGFTMTSSLPEAGRLNVRWAPNHPPRLLESEVLVGESLAGQLELGPLALSPTVTTPSGTQVVAGIIEKSPRESQLLGSVVFRAEDVDAQAVVATSAVIYTTPGAAQQVAAQAPVAVNYFAPESLTVRSPPDPRTMRAEVESSVQLTLIIVSALTLLGAAASLTNAMILAITERRREIGLRRAVGARRRHIFGLIITESTAIGAAGGLVGLTVGLAGILAVTIFQGWLPVFDVRLAVAAVVGGVLVGAAGGVLAALKASRVDPAQALRQ